MQLLDDLQATYEALAHVQLWRGLEATVFQQSRLNLGILAQVETVKILLIVLIHRVFHDIDELL